MKSTDSVIRMKADIFQVAPSYLFSYIHLEYHPLASLLMTALFHYLLVHNIMLGNCKGIPVLHSRTFCCL